MANLKDGQALLGGELLYHKRRRCVVFGGDKRREGRANKIPTTFTSGWEKTHMKNNVTPLRLAPEPLFVVMTVVFTDSRHVEARS